MIKSLFISGVQEEYTAEFIANLFYVDEIATVSRITLLPEDHLDETMDSTKKYFKAYIEILHWHDSPKIRYMQENLCAGINKTLLTYDGFHFWEIKINTRPSICYQPINRLYTTIFTSYTCHEPMVYPLNYIYTSYSCAPYNCAPYSCAVAVVI